MPQLFELQYQSETASFSSASYTEELLVSDSRCKTTPAQIIEQKLRAALSRPGEPRKSLRLTQPR